MEVFTGGDHPMQHDVIHCPDDVFSQSLTDVIFSNPTPDIHPPEINAKPVQKLVPVRKNYGAIYHGHSLTSCNADYLLPIHEQNSAPEIVLPPATNALTTDLQAECRNIISILESDYSSSSGEEYEPSVAAKVPLGREKKKMTIKKLELLLENIMNQLMQKQDRMHKQLIEMVMEKEQERIILEEAWKQQEIERARTREEERAVENTRSLALISFIQNLLGHNFETHNSSIYTFKSG